MTYGEAINEWMLAEPQPEDFPGEPEWFEDDLIELRDDRELKLECLRLAVSIQAYQPQDPIELARAFYEFAIA